jgi:hypothetical protein
MGGCGSPALAPSGHPDIITTEAAPHVTQLQDDLLTWAPVWRHQSKRGATSTHLENVERTDRKTDVSCPSVKKVSVLRSRTQVPSRA